MWMPLLLRLTSMSVMFTVIDVTSGNVDQGMMAPASSQAAVTNLTGHVCTETYEVAENVTRRIRSKCPYVVYFKCGFFRSRKCTNIKYRRCDELITHTEYRNTTRDVCCDGWRDAGDASCSIRTCNPRCSNGSVCHVTDAGARCVCPDGSASMLCTTVHILPVVWSTSIDAISFPVNESSNNQNSDRSRWVWPTVGVVVSVVAIIVVVAMVLFLLRRRATSEMSRGAISRFTESFRKRLGKEGISNPVFTTEGGNHTAPSVDFVAVTEDGIHNESPMRDRNNLPAIPGTDNSENGAVTKQADGYGEPHAMKASSSSNSGTMNHYEEHDPGSLPRGYTCIDDMSVDLTPSRNRHPATTTNPSKRPFLKKPLKAALSEDLYEPIGEPYPQIGLLNETDKARVGQSRDKRVEPGIQQTEPKREAPKLPNTRRKKEPPQHIYGNIDQPETAPRNSDGNSSEGESSSGEIYINVSGTSAHAHYVIDGQHGALTETDDTYEFAPNPTELDSVYISHDGIHEYSPSGTMTISDDQERSRDELNDQSVSENDHESDPGDIYQIVDDDELYDYPSKEIHIENPLFGLDIGDIYENDEELNMRHVSLGSDHIYETVA